LDWAAVNDGVMGGLSRSGFEQTEEGAVFTGTLSLENNGGFASIRFANPSPDLRGFDTLVLRVRGDGRSYQLRLRDDRRFDGVAWAAPFETVAGDWQEIRLPLEGFTPTFRGRVVTGAGELRLDRVYQITLMLADKNSGAFRLELGDLRGESGGSLVPGPDQAGSSAARNSEEAG
jgi:monofunctional biosynthetic peptidoglycan transglycosylase